MATATVTTVNRSLPVVMSSQSDADLPSISRCYAHGTLEDRMGWDCLCGTIADRPGIHPVVFRDEDGEVSCLAFIWRDSTMPMGIPGRMATAGLIVAADDAESIAHAMSKMLKGKGC